MRRRCLSLGLLLIGGCTFPDGAAPGERNAEVESCQQRAASTEGASCPPSSCPAGERCSPRAPQGLRFRGAIIAEIVSITHVDETPKPMAVGGDQRIRFDVAWGSMDRPVIRALSEDPEILEVITASATEVHVRGHRQGRARLRIQDELGLLDRIALDVVEVERLEVGPLIPRLGDRPFPGFEPERHGFDRWSLLQGEPALVYVRVFGPAGRRLVDQALTDIRSPTATRTVARADGWDFVTVLAGPAPTSPLVLRAGDFVAGFDLPVGEPASTIELMGGSTAPPTEIRHGRPCFVARRADGGAVLTQRWRLVPGPGVAVNEVLSGPGTTCAILAQSSARRGTLAVEAAGARASFGVRLD